MKQVDEKEFLNKYFDNITEDAKGKATDLVKDAIQDYLVERGYGKDKAEAIIDFITVNNKDINYDSILNMKNDSRFAAKLADLEVFETIDALSTYSEYIKNAADYYNKVNKMAEDMDNNGYCEPEDLKELLSHFLGDVNSLAGKLPTSNNLTSTALDGLKDYIMGGVDLVIEEAETNRIYEFIVRYDSRINNSKYYKINYIAEKNYEKGPTLKELYEIYDEFGESANVFDPYLEWRITYEFNQELEKSGLTTEEYFSAIRTLSGMASEEKESNLWDRFCDFIYGLFNQSKDADFIMKNIDKQEFYSHFTGDEERVNTGRDILTKFGSIKSEFDRAKTSQRSTGYNVIDPLIIDLGKDGFDIEQLENGTHFDLDGNGFAERMNWTRKDGFLALDLNGNGVIDNGGELFGDRTQLAS